MKTHSFAQAISYDKNMRNRQLGSAFWDRVDRLLKKRNMLQTTLAYKAGIADGTLSSAKNKHSIPLADTAVRIAAALNTSVEYLVTGHDACNDEEGDGELEDALRYIRTSRPAGRFAKAMPLLSLAQYEALEGLLKSWEIEINTANAWTKNVAEHPKP